MRATEKMAGTLDRAAWWAPSTYPRVCRARSAVVDVRAVLQERHDEVSVADLPPALLPRKGRYGLVDHEKVFTASPGADVFDLRGVDRDAGCLVLVRPDQYVAAVLPLDDPQELAGFLARTMRVVTPAAPGVGGRGSTS